MSTVQTDLHPGEIRVATVRRRAVLGAWCFVTLGVGHLLLMALATVGARSAPAQRALDAMQAVPFTVLGIARGDMATMYFGLSVLVGLVSVGYGTLNLLAYRLAPEVLARGTAVLWTNLAVAAGALIVAAAAFPVPPIVLLALAVGAYASGLVAAGRRTA